MKYLLFYSALVFIVFGRPLQATHILGGEIYYDQLDSGRFVFTLTMYRDCGGIPLPSQDNLTIHGLPNNSFIAFNVFQESLLDLSNLSLCDSIISGSGPGNCVNNQGPNNVQMGIYRSDTIQLQGIPPQGGWTVVWSECCRNPAIDNLQFPGGIGHSIWTKILPYTPSGQSNPIDVRHYSDHSARFQNPAFYISCSGQPSLLNFAASDTDQDSLFYQWTDPMDLSLVQNNWNPPIDPSPVLWQSPFGTTNQLPDPSTNPSNVAALLDNNSGLISYTGFTSGMFVLGVKVEAWRNGVMISESARDAVYQIVNCSPTMPPPVLSVAINGNSSSLNSTPWGYSSDLLLGDTLSFDFVGSDFGYYPSTNLPIYLQFFGIGDGVGQPYGSNNCLIGPCLNIQPGAGQTGFVSTLTNTVELEWFPDCSVFVDNPNRQILFAQRSFVLGMSNQNCPIPSLSQRAFLINLRMSKSEPPHLTNVQAQGGNNVLLQWSLPSDTGSGFQGYIVYFKPSQPSNSNWTIVDTIFNFSSNQVSLNSLPNEGGGWYYMASISRCGFESTSSDTLFFSNIGQRENDLTEFSIYPNPTNGHFSLFWDAQGSARASLTILDMRGREVYVGEIYKGKSELSLSLTEGNYILKATDDKRIWFDRLIVQDMRNNRQ